MGGLWGMMAEEGEVCARQFRRRAGRACRLRAGAVGRLCGGAGTAGITSVGRAESPIACGLAPPAIGPRDVPPAGRLMRAGRGGRGNVRQAAGGVVCGAGVKSRRILAV